MGWYADYRISFKVKADHNINTDDLVRKINNCKWLLPVKKYFVCKNGESKESRILISYIEKWNNKKINNWPKIYGYLSDGFGNFKAKLKDNNTILETYTTVYHGDYCFIYIYLPVFLFFIGEENVEAIIVQEFCTEEFDDCISCSKVYGNTIVIDNVIDELKNSRLIAEEEKNTTERPLPTWYLQ